MASNGGKSSPAWLLMPSPELMLDKEIDMSRMPKLFSDPDNNKLAWNMIGTTISVGGLTAAATIIANKIAQRKWEKKRKNIHESKINSLFPISTPNKNPDTNVIRELRSIGLGDDNKPLTKKASSWTNNIIPVLSVAPIALLARNLVAEDLKTERKEELEKEIEEKRKHLQGLYADLLARIQKKASSEDIKGLAKEAKMSILERAGTLLVPGALLGTAVLSALASYYFTKKHDDDQVKTKILEKQVLPQNLTNIPDTLAVITGDDGAIPETRKEQKYIDQLNKAVEDLG